MSRRFELFQKALDNNGDPVSGATLEFFVGGSSFGVAKDVYSNADLTTPLPQPISYDSAGNRSADIFCSGALYDVRFTVGSTIVTIANYDPGLAAGLGVTSAVPVEFGGTAANNAATARLNLGAASSAALSSVQDSVTALQVAVATGVNGGGEFGALAALDQLEGSDQITAAGLIEISSFAYSLLHVREEKSSGTDGGTFTSGAWQTRVLNTEKTNEIADSSVNTGTGAITLPAGTYWIEARSPAAGYVGGSNWNFYHKAKLRNTSDSSDILIGSNATIGGSSSQAQSDSVISGRFTLSAQKNVEIQHRISTTQNTFGFGIAVSLGVVEVYSEVKIWKVR